MTEAEKKANPRRSYVTLVFDAVMAAGAGLFAAYHSITGYAHSNFEKAGLFKKIEADIADAVKKADPKSISDAIKSSGVDLETGPYLGGIFGEMENKYWAGVKNVFKEEGAGTLATKWQKVLSTAQKTKTSLFTAGATIGVGALAYWMTRDRNTDTPSASPGDTKFADRMLEERTDDKANAR